MIRRAALQYTQVTGQPITIVATGWVLAWLTRTDALGNQSLVASFEENQHGFVTEVPMTQIEFQDGAPAAVPEL